MNIDYKASLSAKQEIFISAPLEKVWLELTEIDRWSEWQPDVTSSKLKSELAVGTLFHWKAKGLSIISKIQELVPMHRIGWTGNLLGMRAIHIWTLNEQNNGTHVITEESLSGWFPKVLKIFDQNFLEKSLVGSLQVLKTQAEKK